MVKKPLDRIYGRHPVREVLRADRRRSRRLYLAEGLEETPLLDWILKTVEERDIPIQRTERSRLDEQGVPHQGVILVVDPYPYVDLDALLAHSREPNESALYLLLDLLQDPQNVGTLLRTAEAVGVEGVVLPRRRAARVTPAVVSASAGACEHLAIAQGNLAQAIQRLKTDSVWIAGLDRGEDAIRYDLADYSGSIGIVVGSEGQGLRRLVRDSCDFIVELPMMGKVESLNAAVAGSILLFHIARIRGSG